MPPYEPGMSGVYVHNYHYLGNLVVAELIRVFHLPLIETQYQYFTPLISILLGLSIIILSQILSLKKRFCAWLLFFMYFGSDLVYLLVSIMQKQLNFNMSSLEDGTKFLTNPPRSFGVIVLFIVFSLFILWIKTKKHRFGWIMGILTGSLIAFKVYIGYFALSGFLLITLYFLLSKKYLFILPLILAMLISLFLYLPVNKNAGGLYYVGTSVFENFIVQKELLLKHLELARQTYAAHNNTLRVIEYELIFAALYFIGIFGTKLIGLLQSPGSLRLFPKEFHILLLGGIIFSLPIGLFFNQTSGGANSFNFIVSVFLFISIYTALSCYYFLEKITSPFRYILIIVIIAFTLPRIIFEANTNLRRLQSREDMLVNNIELEALNYLKNNSPQSSLIAISPKNFIFNFEQSSYLSFLADRQEFLAGTGISQSHGVDVTKRMQSVNTIFFSDNCNDVWKTLSNNKINYLLLSGSDLKCIKTEKFLTTVYFNSDTKILRYTGN